MTHERLFLIWHSIALLALFTAVGSGPAVGLIRDRRLRIATMPILGFALTASVLVTASHFLPIETATWTLLLPGAALSLGIALFLRRKLPATGRAGELAIPGAALVVGIALALAPPLQQGAQGPFALMIDDAWSYSASSLFLQHHRTDARLPASVGATDLETAYGAGAVSNDARIGVDSTDAASATIFHADTGSTLSPLLAVLFGFIPLGIWLVVRGLGGSWPAAALGAALGLTPAILSMVEDTALGNLAGEALAAPALFFVVSSLRAERSSRLDAVVAGVLLGGMAAVFPEFLIPAAIIIACICLALGIGQVRQRAIREWALLFGGRVGLAAVTAIVVAPNAVPRAFHYLLSHAVNSGFSNTLPSRDLTVENMGAWAFGLHHLYELPSISSLPPSHRVFYVYFPVVLAAIVLVGVVRLRRSGLLVLVPILVAPAIGLYTFHRFQGGGCQYCLWKSLTFMVPFLVVGVAFGIEWLWRGHGPRGAVYLERTITAAVAVLALVAVGQSNKRLLDLTRSAGVFCPSQFHDLGNRLDRLPSRSPVLIEGVGSMPQPIFMLPAAYFAAHDHGHPVLFDAGNPPSGIAYLGLYPTTVAPFYSPNYGYVLTSFEDVRSSRKPLGRYGPLLLERRAPIDVVVSPSGLAVDGATPRIPWVSTPFELRVANRREVNAAIRISLARPQGGSSTLMFKEGEHQLETTATTASEVCVDVHLSKGSTVIDATPVLDPLTLPPSPPWALQKALGLAAISAAPGRCGVGQIVQPVSLFDGWFPVELSSDGSPFRWMGSSGTVQVGTAGVARPATRFEASVKSLLHRRRVDVWLGEKHLASFKSPAGRWTKIGFVVPAGEGVANLLFAATPPAESASTVTPGDTRLLSVALSHISSRPVTAARTGS